MNFQEIVNYVVDHGRKSLYYLEDVNTEVNYTIEKDNNLVTVNISHWHALNQIDYELYLTQDNFIEHINFGEDHTEIVKRINDLEIIP